MFSKYVIILFENSAGIIIQGLNVSRECIGIVAFCMHDYTSRIRIRSILMEFLETSDCTDESRKDETCLQFKMNKHYIKT